MIRRDYDDEMWSRFVFELVTWPQEVTLVRWTQPSGPLCLWQCLRLEPPWKSGWGDVSYLFVRMCMCECVLWKNWQFSSVVFIYIFMFLHIKLLFPHISFISKFPCSNFFCGKFFWTIFLSCQLFFACFSVQSQFFAYFCKSLPKKVHFAIISCFRKSPPKKYKKCSP